MASRVDVVVAGGGLAGSVAATELAQAGFSVRVAERKSDPGAFNYCAEAVSARSIAPFGVMTDDLVSAPIDGGLLGGPDGRLVRLRWPGVGFILHRDRLMRRVFDRAVQAGADCRLEHEVVAVERDREGRLESVRVRAGEQERRWPCTAVLAADGIASGVGRLAGVETTLAVDEIYSCAQYRLSGVEVEEGFPEFWIGDVHAPGGYAWVFPKGPEEANVGLAMVANRPSARAESATQWLKRFRRSRFLERGKIESYITGGIPTLVRPPRTAAQGVVLAGDAARSADPLSAAGIAEAMDSGAKAAHTLGRALAEGDLSRRRLERASASYAEAHPRLKVMSAIRRVFDRLDDTDKQRLVKACHDAFHDRRIDEMDPLRMFLQLLRMSPALLRHARHLTPLSR